MDELRIKALFYFSAAIFLSIILGWFGSLFFTHSGSISTTAMILFGAGMIISGICIFSLAPQMVTILAAIGFLLVGLYSFGRAYTSPGRPSVFAAGNVGTLTKTTPSHLNRIELPASDVYHLFTVCFCTVINLSESNSDNSKH
jgi:hypothetical protein